MLSWSPRSTRSTSGSSVPYSYHLVATATGSYIARHDHVLGRLTLRAETWIRMRLRWSGGWLELWSDDVLQGRFPAREIDFRLLLHRPEGRQHRAALALDRGDCPAERARHSTFQFAQSVVPSVVPEPAMGLALPPLGLATRRNLIYHVWPKSGSNWQWNVEQILARIDLFNGKRIIAIVEGEHSDPAAAVMELPGRARLRVPAFGRTIPPERRSHFPNCFRKSPRQRKTR